MADATITSALGTALAPGRHGRPDGEPGVTLAERLPAGIRQLHGVDAPALASVAEALALAAPPAHAMAHDEHCTLAWNGAGDWLAVAWTRTGGERLATLPATLAGSDATVTDLGHARTVLDVGGPAARELLASGCPLDVDALPVGASAASLFGPFNVQVLCLAEHRFGLLVLRSFGQALYEMLLDEGLEFGVLVRDAGA